MHNQILEELAAALFQLVHHEHLHGQRDIDVTHGTVTGDNKNTLHSLYVINNVTHYFTGKAHCVVGRFLLF